MYARHESARRHRDTSGYRAVLLVAAVVVTASATTSCTNLAATPPQHRYRFPAPPRRRRP